MLNACNSMASEWSKPTEVGLPHYFHSKVGRKMAMGVVNSVLGQDHDVSKLGRCSREDTLLNIWLIIIFPKPRDSSIATCLAGGSLLHGALIAKQWPRRPQKRDQWPSLFETTDHERILNMDLNLVTTCGRCSLIYEHVYIYIYVLFFWWSVNCNIHMATTWRLGSASSPWHCCPQSLTSHQGLPQVGTRGAARRSLRETCGADLVRCGWQIMRSLQKNIHVTYVYILYTSVYYILHNNNSMIYDSNVPVIEPWLRKKIKKSPLRMASALDEWIQPRILRSTSALGSMAILPCWCCPATIRFKSLLLRYDLKSHCFGVLLKCWKKTPRLTDEGKDMRRPATSSLLLPSQIVLHRGLSLFILQFYVGQNQRFQFHPLGQLQWRPFLLLASGATWHSICFEQRGQQSGYCWKTTNSLVEHGWTTHQAPEWTLRNWLVQMELPRENSLSTEI